MFCHNCGAALADQTPFCGQCGTPTRARGVVARQEGPSRLAAGQAQKVARRLRPESIIVLAAGALLVIVIFVVSFTENSTRTSTTTPEPKDVTAALQVAPEPQVEIPPLQKSFTAMIASFIPRYNAADTEIRKTNVRFERRDAIVRYFSESGRPQFQGWVGTVERLKTESDGEAHVAIKLRRANISVETWNNSLSDIGSHTMIARSDPLYQSLADTKDGDEVTVSGEFLLGGQDYIREASFTEEGSMTRPEFIVRFSRINRGQALLGQTVAQAQGSGTGFSTSVVGWAQPAEGARGTPAVDSVVQRVPTAPTLDRQPEHPYPATCEVTNADGSTCIIESHSRVTDASAGEDWRITIINPSFAPAVFTARIELQDDAGAVVAASSWADLAVGGYGRHVFTGRLEHDNRVTFARMMAKLQVNPK